jgi:hypothetical protein
MFLHLKHGDPGPHRDFFGALQAYSLSLHLGLMGMYLREIELDSRHKGELPENLGWEHCFESANSDALTKVRIAFWDALDLITLLVWISAGAKIVSGFS